LASPAKRSGPTSTVASKSSFLGIAKGKKDENSSCWVRVTQHWAGKGYGTFFLPRIGQEVVISFIDGNPDRPLITGAVYNAEQTVPYRAS
jgi:type VI secretion system secreted protein VgrG